MVKSPTSDSRIRPLINALPKSGRRHERLESATDIDLRSAAMSLVAHFGQSESPLSGWMVAPPEYPLVDRDIRRKPSLSRTLVSLLLDHFGPAYVPNECTTHAGPKSSPLSHLGLSPLR
ncbi:hypothetical protein BREVUG8_10403 [Brevundimonas sp. G8]|nr:hypothetical protein BREVUG8_10403 [Brevundimonas sp. G8]